MRQSLFYLSVITILLPAIAKADSNAICSWDGTLSSAAGSLISKGERPDTDALVQAVREAGSSAVALRAIWVSNDDGEKVDGWLRKMRAQSDAPLACGDARSENARLVIAEAHAGSLAIIDRTSTRIKGRLIASFGRPQLVISYNNGEIRRYRIDRQALETGIAFATEPLRPVHVQLIAYGPAGPRPIAERIITQVQTKAKFSLANSRTKRLSSSKSSENDRGVRVESKLWARLDELRETRGISDLRNNRLIERVAARHAQSVCDTGRAFHELAPGDNPEVRLAREGVRARIVGETIALSANPDAAFLALTKSPSHKSTLLDPRFTDAGVGLASDPSGKVCLVFVLAAWPRFVGR